MAANYEQPSYLDKRVRYFDGQFLKDQDFIDEQKYHIDRTRRLSRILQVSGISEGLAISVPGSDRVTVNPGTGIDSKGRLIVLSTPEEVSLINYRNQTVSLFISYQEIETDRAQEGSEGNRRWHEKPLIQVALEGATGFLESILLAKMNVDKDGVVKVDNSARQYSGVHLPSAGGKGPILRSSGDGANTKAVLTGDLSVSGILEVNSLSIGSGGITASSATINGNLTASGNIAGGSLSVGAGNITAGSATINGNLTASGNIAGSSLSVGAGSITAGSATINGNLSFGTTTRQMINLLPPSFGIGVQSNTEYFRTVQNFAWYKGGSHTDTALDAGGGTLQMAINDGNVGIGIASPQAKLDVAGAIKASSYKVTSYAVGGIASPAITIPLVANFTTSTEFPGMSYTFTLSAPAVVLVYYSIVLDIKGYLITRLMVDGAERERAASGNTVLNQFFANNTSFWIGELEAGNHRISVQYRLHGYATTQNPSGSDFENRVLRVIVLGAQ